MRYASTGGQETLQSIQFLRFVAAAIVVVHHASHTIELVWPTVASPLATYLYGFGVAGVHIFFVISGFVMVYVKRTTPAAFLYRRLIRIFPIYWAIAAMYLLHRGDVPDGVVQSFLLLPGYSSNIIGAGWTLAYELYFYVCFALVLGLPRRGLGILTIFFVACIASRALIRPAAGSFLDVVTNSLLLEFLAGAWIARLFLSGISLSKQETMPIILLGAGAFIGGLMFDYTRLPSVIVWGIPSALIVCGFVFAEAALPNWIKRIAFLGDSSYSLYLIHMLLIRLMMGAISAALLPNVAYREALVLLFLFVCCFTSLACYRFVERPLIALFSRTRRSRHFLGPPTPTT